MQNQTPKVFSRYDVLIIAILSILQFTIVLDFMVLSPLGAMLIPALKITPEQFGYVVSAYAISAFVAALATAGFADKFDRKKLLLFFYAGFIVGTLLCGIAPNYPFLLMARIVTGLFGGVMGSISYAIITDLFRLEVRGRVMGFVQMAFASCQALGIPIALYLAGKMAWHIPFLMIVALSAIVFIVIAIYMKPVDAHLKLKNDRNAFKHLFKTLTTPTYARAFAATTLLATGGFMLMPFGTLFAVNNLGLNADELWKLYAVTGLFSMVTGPLIGKLADKLGKYQIFVAGSILTMTVVLYYCNLGITPMWFVMVLNVILFAGITSRIISSTALITGVPSPADRGAFMSVNSAVQYVSGGIAAIIAGQIVYQANETAPLQNYDVIGYVVAGATVITIVMMYFVHQYVMRKNAASPGAPNQPAANTAAPVAAEPSPAR